MTGGPAHCPPVEGSRLRYQARAGPRLLGKEAHPALTLGHVTDSGRRGAAHRGCAAPELRLAAWSALAAAVVGLAVLAGCGGRERTPRGTSNELQSWLQHASYSTWYTYRRQGRELEIPDNSDGITLGSPNVFAAIGCNRNDLSSIDVLWTDRRNVRALAKPLVMRVAVNGGKARKLGDLPEQTLRRVRHTSIAVSESKQPGLSVTCVDFAPMGPEDNFLVRWALVQNTGAKKQDVRLVFDVPAAGEWRRITSRAWQRGERLAIVSGHRLRQDGDAVGLSVGRLGAGEAASAALFLVGAAKPDKLREDVARAQVRLGQVLEMLEDTRADWERWCARTPLKTGDQRTDDLLDSLLCLVRAHVGPEAIHTGSVRYPHNRAWVRDTYWVQRALLDLGRKEEALRGLEFFHASWRKSGLASSYGIPDGRPYAYGYSRVELPHYLVLMVRDAERLGGVDGTQYWDMVRGCLDGAAVPDSGLQPMNGDETWLLAAPVRDLDDLFSNTALLTASAEYGAQLAARVGDQERAARYQELAKRARRALDQFAPRPGQAEWYAIGRGADGSLDLTLTPGVLAQAAVLGVLPASNPYLTGGLIASWNRLNFDRGIRSSARSPIIEGGAPGYVLYAASESPACTFTGNLMVRLEKLCSATGCMWELHDIQDPRWSGETRRLWDSAVLLMGMKHALFDAQRAPRGIEFTPKVLPRAVPPPAPPFEGERLLADSGPALVLDDASPAHADRIARELLRQRGRQYAVGAYGGAPPANRSAIIVSRRDPPAGWLKTPRGYWIRQWDGPPQLWVRNKGNVYLDTDPLVVDLVSYLMPKQPAPLPYPDATLDLLRRFGAAPTGTAELSARSGGKTAKGQADLAGGRVRLDVAGQTYTVQTTPKEGRLELVVIAPPRTEAADLSITFPAGWWLARARDMTGSWDRVHDPAGEVRLPDGRIRLEYHFRPSAQSLSLTFDLGLLRVLRAGEKANQADQR